MLTLFRSRIILVLAVAVTTVWTIDYEDNDLAKVCRPLDRQLDLLFILDGSGSVSGSTFATQMAMLNKIVDMIEIGPKNTQIAVMQYSSYTRVEFGFSANPNKESLRAALQKIRHISGTTKTGKALDKALQVFTHDAISGARLDQEDVAQVAVVVTDGHSHDDPVPAALRLRQAGVQILALGIGAHINMGELLEITGDENLAFQNLTSQASLDQFVHQFKKIAVGEHCDFSRGPHGAEINCHSDSIEIGVSTVNPFRGHLYVPGQFHRPECVATPRNSTSKEIRLSIGLMSCNTQKQFKLNPKGVLFETSVVLKFHPVYNTKTDKVFKVQCFYPEKAPKLAKKYLDNRMAVSDSNELKMPCSYKLTSSNSKTTDQCKLEDVRVGDQIIHSWECDKDSFDTYQSMLIHSCVIIDLNSGINKTVIDSSGCPVDSSVMDSPDYVEPLSAFAIGKAVKFPDSSLIQMQCQLRFCDRLLGECETILPPRCRRTRRAAAIAEGSATNVTYENIVFRESGRSWDFANAQDDTDEYEGEAEETTASTTMTTTTTTATPTSSTTQTPAPLVTFQSQHQEKKLMPPRRRLTIDQRITAGSHVTRSLPFTFIHSPPGPEMVYPHGKLITGAELPVIIPAQRAVITNGQTPHGRPRVITFPAGGMDVKINTQNVAIVGNDRLKLQYQKELKERQRKLKPASTKILPKSGSPLPPAPPPPPPPSTPPPSPLPALSSLPETNPSVVFDEVIEDIERTPHEPKSSNTAGLEGAAKVAPPPPSPRAASVAQKTNANVNDPFQETERQNNRVRVESEESVEESLEEVEPAVQLEQRIASTVRSDTATVESQVISVRDLEVMSDPNLKEKWCKK